MAQVTQARWQNRLALDYEQLSGRYFGIGALLATIRILWLIARSSGVFGSPPDPALLDFESAFGAALWVYTGLGLVALIAILAGRSQLEQNISTTRIIINYSGVVFFLLLSLRVRAVVAAQSFPIAVWGLQLTNGLVLGGVYALVALGYTLVYGILFMINFAHGEVLVIGTFGGYFALTYLMDLGGGTFEVGAAQVAGVLMPLITAILFLPLELLVSRGGRERTSGAEVSPTWLLTLSTLPVRFIVGALVGFGLLQALGAFTPQLYRVVITVLGLLFIVAVGMVTSMLVSIGLERIAYRPLRHAPRLTPLISAIGASFFLQQ